MESVVEIRFEREAVEAVVAAGSFLNDVANRLGVRIDEDCIPKNGVHFCEVAVTTGADLLSLETKAERKHFGNHLRKAIVRLACEARIEKCGEIVIMTKEKAEEPKVETAREPFQEEFSALPLEKKIARLMRMEAETLGETFAFVVNSPLKVVEKVGDVIAEFGIKLEKEAKEAARSAEAAGGSANKKNSATKPKTPSRRRTPGRKPKA